MHLMITKTKYKDREKKYAKVVHSYRDGETSRQKIILNLGPVRTEEDLARYRKILRDMKEGQEFIKVDNISAKDAKQFGITYTANKLLERYELSTVLKDELSKNEAEFDVYKVIKALIINRLERPSSELAAHDWIHEDYCEELDVQEHHLYRALDHLIPRKEDIEEGIFNMLKKKLNLSTDLTFYDLTSSYFEGQCCLIAVYGHSRDHRPDRKQIVIGLAMCDGIPIMHDVYKGNTADKITLKSMQDNLNNRFGIKETVIVADNGLLTEKNIQSLEEAEYDYILACKRRKNKISQKLLIRKISSEEQQCAKEVYKEKVIRNDKEVIRRYILCLDKKTLKERLEELKNIRRNIEKKLKELHERYKRSQNSKKGKKITRDSLMQQAYKLLGRNKRIFKVEFKDGLRYSLNKESWEYEKKIAGKFLLITTTEKKADDVMKAYKQHQTVENAFDEIKNFLDIRGIYHWKTRRVKAHVFVCVLSFLLESIIKKFTKETARVVLRKLRRIKVVKLDLEGKEKKLVTKITKETKMIFDELNIPKPMLPNLLG